MEDRHMKAFIKGIMGFPANIFNEDDPNHKHNQETMEKLSRILRED